MQFSRSFYRLAAIASALSVLTTLGLIFLPGLFPPAAGALEARLSRVGHPIVTLHAWIYLVHPFCAGAAALGAAFALRRFSPALAFSGAAGFTLWAVTEAAQQCLTFSTFRRWAAAATDSAARQALAPQVKLYDDLWDAMYLLLLIGFVIGNASFASALLPRQGVDRLMGAFFVGAVVLTLPIISGELGGPSLPGWLAFWLYPAIQPLGRGLLTFWLWRRPDDSGPTWILQSHPPLDA